MGDQQNVTMGIMDEISEILGTGDPEIISWFLVQNKAVPFILCGCYFSFVTVIGPAIMKHRKPLELRNIMVGFNAFLVTSYVISVSYILSHLQYLGPNEFCQGTNVRRGHISYSLTSMFWVIYVLKYLQFGDTVFFILRKREDLLTRLHIIHHTLAPILGWITLRTEKSGFQTVPVMMNATVHIVMYSYYGLAAMGPQMKKYLWWKKYVTLLQMCQFVMMVLFVTVVTPLTGCSVQTIGVVMDIFFPTMFFILFYNYYRHAFGPESKKVKSS